MNLHGVILLNKPYGVILILETKIEIYIAYFVFSKFS